MTLTLLSIASTAAAHGIPLILNSPGGIPTSFTAVSDAPNLVYETTPPAGYDDLFLSRFGDSATTDTTLYPGTGDSYVSNSGFVGLASAPPIAAAYYTVVSPLLFADGSGAPEPATAGTYLGLRNRFGGGGSGHTGAETGGVDVTGTSGILSSPNVSMTDTHELAFRLFLAPGSTQTFGAYGFAYTVTVEFDGGPTVTSDPLVAVYQMRDPTIAGGMDFNDVVTNAAAQEAASRALYGKLVPEPSSLALATLGSVALGACGWRRLRRRVGNNASCQEESPANC